MKKFVFNEETFNEYQSAETAATEYAERTIDEFLDNCFGEVEVVGYSYRTSNVLRHTDAILFRVILSDYCDDCINQIEEIEEEEDEEGNDGEVVSSSRKI